MIVYVKPSILAEWLQTSGHLFDRLNKVDENGWQGYQLNDSRLERECKRYRIPLHASPTLPKA